MTLGRLKGKKIVVTRARTQAGDLSDRLKEEGAIVYEIPSIEIVERPEGIELLNQELNRISDYSWLILTSVNSVLLLDSILRKSNSTWKLFESLKIACIGKATAKKVRELGGQVSLVPPRFQAESLAEELSKSPLLGQKILLPRAAGSRQVLPQQLRKAGASVEEIHIYQAELAQHSKEDLKKLLSAGQVDFLTFTSSSTVRNFAEIAGDLPWQTIPVICIGPITAETLREYGVEPAAEAEEFTIEGLVQTIIGRTSGKDITNTRSNG